MGRPAHDPAGEHIDRHGAVWIPSDQGHAVHLVGVHRRALDSALISSMGSIGDRYCDALRRVATLSPTMSGTKKAVRVSFMMVAFPPASAPYVKPLAIA